MSKFCDISVSAAERWRARFLGAVLLALLMVGESIAAETTVTEIDVAVGDAAVEPVEPLAAEELEALVGPIALYPDDLIAIVLPASTYPLQVVQAQRFLQDRKDDPNLQPSEEWDDSIIALLNYPEALALLNEDLDWTWQLGEAVLVQQEDVIAAVGAFRDRARIAGNLHSDEHQIVEETDDGAIVVRPADPKFIYVPYYEPARVVVRHAYPVYHYYPYAYPVYYYPYPSGYRFYSGYFWGVTSAFSIGWGTHRVHVHYYGYSDHPYYGHTYYYHHFYYRRPPAYLSFGSSTVPPRHVRYRHRHHAGNYWAPHRHRYGASPRYHHRFDGVSGHHGSTGALRRDHRDTGQARERRRQGATHASPRQLRVERRRDGLRQPSRTAGRDVRPRSRTRESHESGRAGRHRGTGMTARAGTSRRAPTDAGAHATRRMALVKRNGVRGNAPRGATRVERTPRSSASRPAPRVSAAVPQPQPRTTRGHGERGAAKPPTRPAAHRGTHRVQRGSALRSEYARAGRAAFNQRR